jgi:2-methylcitrate dehydratase PrpD
MTVAQTLAQHAQALAGGRIGPDEPAARDTIVDWFAATIAGSAAPQSTALRTGMGPLAGGSRVVGTSGYAPAPVAALLNGTAAHALELDDIYAPGTFHPGAPIIAAALAVADQTGASIHDFHMAVTVGYEVGCRVARDLGPAHYAHWHTTGTAGSIGAAAAAAVLLRIGDEQLVHALSLAATMSAGLQQTFRSDAAGKPLHSGNAAHAGVVAALAAAGGITGARDVFEGPAGLAHATGSPTSWSYSLAPLAPPLAIKHITVKPYPCCGHTFAPIAAAIAGHDAGVSLSEIERIDVRTYAAAIAVAGNAAPRTPHERRFSIPFVVAEALATGGITADSFTAISDDARGLLPRVTLSVEDSFERRFPDRRGARLLITAAANTYEEVVVDRPGSPQNPLSPDALDKKFLDNAAAVLGVRTTEALGRLRAGAELVSELLVC